MLMEHSSLQFINKLYPTNQKSHSRQQTTMERVLLLVVLILLFSAATAQENAKKDSTNHFLNELTISALKFETPRSNVAQQFYVMKRKDMDVLNPQTTADLVAQSGFVSVQKSQQGGGSPVIRGFEASRILLVVDGVRMNNILFRAGHLQNIITVDNNSLDRLEILSGPGSSMYGSDALGGVIVMNTTRPEFSSSENLSIKGSTMLRYSSANNENTGNVTFHLGGKKSASFTSITYSSFDDLVAGKSKNWFYDQSYGERLIYADRINGKDSIVSNKNPEEQIGSAYHQIDLLQKFAFRTSAALLHELNFQYSTSSDVPRYDRLTDPQNTGLRFAEWYYGPQERLLGVYSLSINTQNQWMDELQFKASYQSIEESRHTRRFNNDNLQHRIDNVKVYGMNLDINKKLMQHTFGYGAELQYNDLASTANQENIVTGAVSPLNTRYPDGKNNMMLSSAYLTHQWQVNSKWLLSDGIRGGYSVLNSTFNDTTFFPFPYSFAENKSGQIAFNAAIIYRPVSSIKTSFMISTGYRVPNVDDLSKVFDSAPGNLIVPNPELKPEKTYTAEYNITWTPCNNLSLETVVFGTLFSDAIITAPYTFKGADSIVYDGTLSRVLANQNKQEAYITGFTGVLRYDINKAFQLNATAGYTYGRITSDSIVTPLDHIPPFTARLQLTHRFKKLRTDFISQYNSKKKIEDYYLNGEDNEQYATPEGMPAWIVFHIKISYQATERFILQTGCDNLLDTQYRVFASGINAPGRNFLLSARYKF